MEFGVAAHEMRVFIAPITDAVSTAMWAARGLFLLGAVEAFAAGDGGGPGNAIADGERFAIPVALQSAAELFDASDRFVAENHRQINLQFAFPQMNIRAADAGHFRADEGSAGFKLRDWKLA
jgi:hypothetical protein